MKTENKAARPTGEQGAPKKTDSPTVPAGQRIVNGEENVSAVLHRIEEILIAIHNLVNEIRWRP